MRILTLDIGGTAIKAAVFDAETGVLTDPHEMASRGTDGGEAVFQRVLQVAARYASYDAVGVSTAGQVDSRRGLITYANDNIPGYTGMRLGDRLKDALGVPVFLANDAHCAAVGEAKKGAARGLRDFVMLTIGTGIGGAAVSDGSLVTGGAGRAGQLGHIVTHAGGVPCVCGGRGCWEQYASTSALVRAASAGEPRWDSGRAVMAAYAAGEPEAAALVDGWIDEVAAGVASLVAVFDPYRVVVGGGVMEGPTRLSLLEERVRALVMPPMRDVSVVAARLGNKAALYGSGFLALDKGRLQL